MSSRISGVAALFLAASLLACSGTVIEQSLGGVTSGTSGGPGACSSGRADCDGDDANGCEVDLDSDDAHCGTCDRDCHGSSCSEGLCQPVVLASELYFPRRIAIDAAYVYWTSPDAPGSIRKLPLGGGAPIILAAGQDDPYDIAVDAAGVYWTNVGDNTVMSLPMAGEVPVMLAESGNPFAIAREGASVYFTNSYSKVTNDEQVMQVPIAGGPASTIATTPGAGMLAVDAESVYWTDTNTEAVWKAPIGGGPSVLIAADVIGLTDIAVDADAVYFNALQGTVRVPLAGGETTPLVWGSTHGIALDGENVYVGTADGKLLRVPKLGGAATTLARTELYPHDIAVDAHSVYWIHGNLTGSLVKVAK